MTWSITSLISKAPRKKKFSDFHQVCICKVPYLGFTYCFVGGSIRGTFSLTLLVAAYQPRPRPYHSQDLMRRHVPNGKSRIPQPEDQFQVCLLHWPDYLRTHFGLRRQFGLKYCTRQVAGALTWKDGLRHLQSIVLNSLAELRASDVQALTRKKRKNGISKAVVPSMGRKVPTKPELHGVNPILLGVMLDYLAIICTKKREEKKRSIWGRLTNEFHRHSQDSQLAYRFHTFKPVLPTNGTAAALQVETSALLLLPSREHQQR